jgi:hypothetical protein
MKDYHEYVKKWDSPAYRLGRGLTTSQNGKLACHKLGCKDVNWNQLDQERVQ